MEKVYHIYAKKECLYNNLSEEQFNNTWETLKGMVGLMKTDYELEDLSFSILNNDARNLIEERLKFIKNNRF